MPHEAQAIVREIIHDLRSALDNLIYEASRRNNNNVEVNMTQFVIADDEESYRSQQWRLRKLTDEEQSKIESIPALQQWRQVGVRYCLTSPTAISIDTSLSCITILVSLSPLGTIKP